MLTMSSKKSNTNEIAWESPLERLSSKSGPSQSVLKLKNAGYNRVKDLLWILPLRLQDAPVLSPFSKMKEGALFLGSGILLGSRFTPAFKRRGKGGAQLFNATLTVKDEFSDELIDLKFFNTYPNFKKSVETKSTFNFMGQVGNYKGRPQIVNPKLDPKELKQENGLLIEYPTVATVSGQHIKSIINKIPARLWDLPSKHQELKAPENDFDASFAFSILHGKRLSSKEERKMAYEALVYHEFLQERLKVEARRIALKSRPAPNIQWRSGSYEKAVEVFPYQLTSDQAQSLLQVKEDFASGRPMMRMIQGDVGCGKTTVALVATAMAVEAGGQVALMCPTESLALQHFETFERFLPSSMRLNLLLGSQKQSEKKIIQDDLLSGKTNVVIGTHTLIQASVGFKNLVFAVIDEQHKFGVEQRLRLSAKGEGVHTLIMSATPIPRTLQLAQYGDLDISTIRSMPKGRAGVKTRVVREENYSKYLSFLKTRLSMGEQAYVVAPAIEESETLDIKNVKEIEALYLKYFPEFSIRSLHGRLSAEEKKKTLRDFADKKINMLISTSVVEVGINVLSATVMSVYDPDRFGLSSLHQLRGRVGRGSKPGFCFLLPKKGASPESLGRLKILEQSSDGFEIAEADLKNRGSGDMFGTDQSGSASRNKVANIFEHFDIFDRVNRDFPIIMERQEEKARKVLMDLAKDQKVSSTI